MDFAEWSERNEFLNRLKTAIQQRTHGRLTRLSFEADSDVTFIDVTSPNYYGVQLAIVAIVDLVKCYAETPEIALRFLIGKHSFQVWLPAKRDEKSSRAPVRPVERRNSLESVEVAVAAT